MTTEKQGIQREFPTPKKQILKIKIRRVLQKWKYYIFNDTYTCSYASIDRMQYEFKTISYFT
jgi:hypothetical protein